jgi:hypothetical protein
MNVPTTMNLLHRLVLTGLVAGPGQGGREAP